MRENGGVRVELIPHIEWEYLALPGGAGEYRLEVLMWRNEVG